VKPSVAEFSAELKHGQVSVTLVLSLSLSLSLSLTPTLRLLKQPLSLSLSLSHSSGPIQYDSPLCGPVWPPRFSALRPFVIRVYRRFTLAGQNYFFFLEKKASLARPQHLFAQKTHKSVLIRLLSVCFID